MKQELAIFMSYDEFDDLVKKTYGQSFEFCADRETPNDTDYVFRVNKEPWKPGTVLDDYDLKRLNEFKQTGKGNYLSHVLLRDLINQDLMVPGTTVIEVSW